MSIIFFKEKATGNSYGSLPDSVSYSKDGNWYVNGLTKCRKKGREAQKTLCSACCQVARIRLPKHQEVSQGFWVTRWYTHSNPANITYWSSKKANSKKASSASVLQPISWSSPQKLKATRDLLLPLAQSVSLFLFLASSLLCNDVHRRC